MSSFDSGRSDVIGVDEIWAVGYEFFISWDNLNLIEKMDFDEFKDFFSAMNSAFGFRWIFLY